MFVPKIPNKKIKQFKIKEGAKEHSRVVGPAAST